MAIPTTTKPSGAVPKRTLMTVLEESVQLDRKITITGPDNVRPDSRYKITEVHADHVVISLLGDDTIVIPFTAISSLRLTATSITIRSR